MSSHYTPRGGGDDDTTGDTLQGARSYLDQLSITLSPLKCHTGKMGVPLLTVLAYHLTVIKLILPVG